MPKPTYADETNRNLKKRAENLPKPTETGIFSKLKISFNKKTFNEIFMFFYKNIFIYIYILLKKYLQLLKK